MTARRNQFIIPSSKHTSNTQPLTSTQRSRSKARRAGRFALLQSQPPVESKSQPSSHPSSLTKVCKIKKRFCNFK